MLSEDTLSGKSILITGGGSGLGLAMAEQFASLGANIGICGRTEEKLNAAKDKLSTHGTKVSAVACDVRDFDAVEQMMEQLQSELGSLNGLVNNAAGNFYCPSEELSANGFRSVVDIVLQGSFNCSRHFGAQLINNKQPGAILNIVTTYTETGSAFVLPSACAKAGVYAMTNTLAYEWAEYGIRVNSIAPGPFPTKGAWDRLMPGGDFEKRFREMQPMKRFGEPEELTNLAAFLMSDMASYINGECVTVDGGERLRGGQFNFVTQMAPRAKLKELFAAMRPKK